MELLLPGKSHQEQSCGLGQPRSVDVLTPNIHLGPVLSVLGAASVQPWCHCALSDAAHLAFLLGTDETPEVRAVLWGACSACTPLPKLWPAGKAVLLILNVFSSPHL